MSATSDLPSQLTAIFKKGFEIPRTDGDLVTRDLPPRLAYCVGRLKWDLHAACYTPKTGGKLLLLG